MPFIRASLLLFFSVTFVLQILRIHTECRWASPSTIASFGTSFPVEWFNAQVRKLQSPRSISLLTGSDGSFATESTHSVRAALFRLTGGWPVVKI